MIDQVAAKPFGMRRNLPHYGDGEFSVFLRKAFIKALGYTDEALERPIIGIVDTQSGYNACHQNIPDLIAAVSRGILLAGGIPVPFPVINLGSGLNTILTYPLRNNQPPPPTPPPSTHIATPPPVLPPGY